MPRRSEPDPLAQIVGLRIRQLREEQGLTMEQLAYESELRSKGHLSNIERGLARPTIYTLKVLADRLEVKLLDLVTFPDEDERQRLIDATRRMSRGAIRKILKEDAATAKKAPAPAAKKPAKKRLRASGNKRSR
nr:helix-turn-helix transcriptional regulator [Polyangium aurulentum]